jgi:predicted DNA-binding transcriptional regulator YafY
MIRPRRPATRLRQILALLADQPRTRSELARLVEPAISVRTIVADLAWLARALPRQVLRTPGGDARTGLWRLDGLPPVPLSRPLDHLTHDELAALIAARGLLRDPDRRSPGWERPSTTYASDPSASLHGLLERAGLAEEARTIAPRAIGVSRFAAAPEPPGALTACLRALATGQALRFRYRNRSGNERDLHAMPLRLVFIRGEGNLFAWAADTAGSGRVKQYRLSRITSREPALRLAPDRPTGCPDRLPHEDVDAMLGTGFGATSSADPSQRRRLVVAIGPGALPDVQDRTWGEAQSWSDAHEHGPGWRRLAFTTSGWLEARGWILSLGAQARAEGPPELVAWLLAQARAMVSDLTCMRAPHPARIAATLSGDDRAHISTPDLHPQPEPQP